MKIIPSRHFALLALLAAMVPPAFAAVVPPGIQLHPTQTLIRNNGSEPETLDPAVAESVGANNITRDLFEGLTANDGDGKIVPGVAESWKQTNSLTWVFKLRQNAKWSNGDPVTAQDCVYGIRRFLDPKTASTYSATYGVFILNGKEAATGKKPVTEVGVKALDKYTVEIKTPFPVAFLPSLMSNNNLGPIHQASVEKFGREWTKPGNMVSNGAYTLKEWQVNSRVVIEKNPHYWDAKNVQLTRVTYLGVEDGNADMKLFESGQNEMVYQLPPGTYEEAKKKFPKDVRNAPMLGIRYYSYQTQNPAFKDMRVRKALSMVLGPRHPRAAHHRRRPEPGLRPDRQGHAGRRHGGVRLGQVAHGEEGRGGEEAAGRGRREARHQVHLLVQHQRVPQEDGDLRAVGVEDQAGDRHRAGSDGVQGAAQEAA